MTDDLQDDRGLKLDFDEDPALWRAAYGRVGERSPASLAEIERIKGEMAEQFARRSLEEVARRERLIAEAHSSRRGREAA